MAPMERYLAEQGYRTVNLDYPSTRYSLEALAEWLHHTLQERIGEEPCHMVCHSMGGLVLRMMLQQHPERVVKRAVMLGTPNRGSELTNYLHSWKLYQWIYGPAGQQLGTDIKLSSACGTCEIGVIAGYWTVDPIGWALLPKPNDGKVSVAATRLESMKDHITLPVTHALMMMHPEVMRQTVQFLQQGRFLHQ